ncbi:MAG TPA: hypothetical protein VMI06_05195, partial [Terriglobia bacterium]|nr:hypothetical protein [Terriglobia bacterium]
MGGRFDGFYYARWEGLNPDGRWGLGVVMLKDGKIYGGDSHSCFIGEFEDHGNEVVARAHIFPLQESYVSVTGDIEQRPWDLPDIRATTTQGNLPLNVQLALDSQRYN